MWLWCKKLAPEPSMWPIKDIEPGMALRKIIDWLSDLQFDAVETLPVGG
jgi:hypothetical protein